MKQIPVRLKSVIRSSLRLIWLRYDENRKLAIKNSMVSRGKYKCFSCKELFKQKEINVDHIKECGGFKTWSELAKWMEILFCDLDNLQILCKKCHLEKK